MDELKEEDSKPDVDENPWAVGSITDFLYFCCPECENKCQTKASFLNHALHSHPKVKNFKL